MVHIFSVLVIWIVSSIPGLDINGIEIKTGQEITELKGKTNKGPGEISADLSRNENSLPPLIK